MDETFDPNLPPSLQPISPRDFLVAKSRPAGRPLSYWLKRFLACNPFYLCSAALLLYGFYRVSADSDFLKQETARLAFNFNSLQFYELMLVITAIFLARRQIWYDSILLVGLENLLVVVPFILISQAALIDLRIVWGLSCGGGLMAVARFGSLKRFVAELHFPVRLLVIGLLALAINAALPGIYRMLHEHKFGTRLSAGPAYLTNEYTWLLIFPALCGLAHFLPSTRATGPLLPQRGWLPLGLFWLWIIGTGVHLYCLGYIYDFALRRDLVAPALWVVSWLLHRRAADWFPGITPNWQQALLVPPIVAACVAASQTGNEVFLVLTVLNAALCALVWFYDRQNRFALQLAFISLAALVGGCPESWARPAVTEFSRGKCLGAGAAGYFLLVAALSRNPMLGLFGALVSAVAVFNLMSPPDVAIHWAAQAGLVFLLIHSLRWNDAVHPGAYAVRICASALWLAHAYLWMALGGTSWMSCLMAALVLVAYLGGRLASGHWGPCILPIAALQVAISGPIESGARSVQSTPIGLLAVIASFLLFGLGTVAALTKHRWNKE